MGSKLAGCLTCATRPRRVKSLRFWLCGVSCGAYGLGLEGNIPWGSRRAAVLEGFIMDSSTFAFMLRPPFLEIRCRKENPSMIK